MIALAISTYMSKATQQKRLRIFKESFASLLSTDFPGKIYVVDDGSVTTEHLDWCRSLKDNRIVIKRHIMNQGISKTKNVGIMECLKDDNIDSFFLIDDDVQFKHPHWFQFYLDASEKTKLQHFSIAVTVPGSDIVRDGVNLKACSDLNGCMLFCTRELVNNIGYFKKFPFAYGYEHCNFTKRHNQKYEEQFTYDLVNRNDLLDLHPESKIEDGKSIVVDWEKLRLNGAHISGNIYEPYF